MNSLGRLAPCGLLVVGTFYGLGCSSTMDGGEEPASRASSLETAAAPRSGACEPFISPEVAAHVREMATKGWAAVNKEKGLLMHGCPAGASGRACLTAYPRASEKPYGQGWEHLPGAALRILREYAYPSSFWTRSSPDGRFVAHGRRNADAVFNMSASIFDLRGDGRQIPANASYDSGFTPDNSGFTFISGSDVLFCNQSLLGTSPQSIKFDEPECINAGDLGLYQSVGAALGGGDYWVAGGRFQNDQGGYDIRRDPDARFGSDPVRFTPMIHNGSAFEPGASIDRSLPYEGDAILSPGAGLVMTRIEGPDHRSLGYALRKLVAKRTGTGYELSTPEIARYCAKGAKATFSYDERWAVIHHYVDDNDEDARDLGFTGRSDPKFAPYRAKGASNVYLMDLVSGKLRRITAMQPGQYALYPHFRADGWMHFIVRTAPRRGEPSPTATEYLVASDAALMPE
ncbi:hypothetical protein [Pendulispora albinea]|uniref:Uncharacterized protein n=1 Tax=Pendulispora albinea TaxID=2741071 RepID=A0ABZ2M315_9BACT